MSGDWTKIMSMGSIYTESFQSRGPPYLPLGHSQPSVEYPSSPNLADAYGRDDLSLRLLEINLSQYGNPDLTKT